MKRFSKMLIGLILLMLVLFGLKLVNDHWLRTRDVYYVMFTDNMRALNIGSHVRMNGKIVGAVRQAKLIETSLRLKIEVAHGTRIRSGSRTKLAPDRTSIGGVCIEITPGSTNEPLLGQSNIIVGVVSE